MSNVGIPGEYASHISFPAKGLTHSSLNNLEYSDDDELHNLKLTWSRFFGWDVKELDESRYYTRKGLIEKMNNFPMGKFNDIAKKWLYDRCIMPLLSYPTEEENILVWAIRSKSYSKNPIDTSTIHQYVTEATQQLLSEEDKKKEFKYLLLKPEEFDEMTKLMDNKEERNTYLGKLNPEDSAKECSMH